MKQLISLVPLLDTGTKGGGNKFDGRSFMTTKTPAEHNLNTAYYCSYRTGH